MMSLVAYGSSDESEEEIVSSQQSEKIQPKIVFDLSASAKRRKECVKITIPSLKEFEDEESPVAPKKPKLQSGSGLFSLLPPPKNTSSLKKPGFVPYVLSSKKEALSSAPQKRETKIEKTEKFNSDALEDQNYVESSEESSKDNLDTATCKDFFSLSGHSSEIKLDDKGCKSSNYDLKTDTSSGAFESCNFLQNRSSSAKSSSSIQPTNETIRNPHFQQYNLPSAEAANAEQESSVHEQSDLSVNYDVDPATEINSKEYLLKDKEFLKLQGRRREFEAVDIIDVNADDQLTDRNEWLMKSLTEESTHRPTRKKHSMPTQQQKRKHQITYLAFQAKEREMDLKNQWALNSRTRRETQAKYGF